MRTVLANLFAFATIAATGSSGPTSRAATSNRRSLSSRHRRSTATTRLVFMGTRAIRRVPVLECLITEHGTTVWDGSVARAWCALGPEQRGELSCGGDAVFRTDEETELVARTKQAALLFFLSPCQGATVGDHTASSSIS